jgi:hypothetical protein
MPRTKKPTGPEAITQHINQLEPELAGTIQHLRQIILDTDPVIGEEIKWNSPSFYYTGDMKPFDPKEYKRDIVVMNLHRGNILLVFPTGVVISDRAGLLEGDYPDGRRMARFNDMEDVEKKTPALQQVIREWISKVDK